MLCLQTIGVSLSLPVVKGKPAQVSLFLPAELAGCLKRSPGPSGCETLYLRGVFKRSSFSLYIFHLLLLHGESDCMPSVCSGAQRSFTFSDLCMWLMRDWPSVWLFTYCCNRGSCEGKHSRIVHILKTCDSSHLVPSRFSCEIKSDELKLLPVLPAVSIFIKKRDKVDSQPQHTWFKWSARHRALLNPDRDPLTCIRCV